jgi:hypothetical protein
MAQATRIEADFTGTDCNQATFAGQQVLPRDPGHDRVPPSRSLVHAGGLPGRHPSRSVDGPSTACFAKKRETRCSRACAPLSGPSSARGCRRARRRSHVPGVLPVNARLCPR